MSDDNDADAEPVRRKRDATATRAALLRAAGELFAERGFDQTTVRDVADRAQVNQALLFRYFGSKHELFARVLAETNRAWLDEESATEIVPRMLDGILRMQGDPGEGTLLAMLRSFGDEQAAQVLRDELGDHYASRLAELTDADDAELRADLVLAWFFGLAMVRSVLHKPSLVEADADVVTDYVMRATSVLLERAAPPSDD